MGEMDLPCAVCCWVAKRNAAWQFPIMKLTAVFEPAKEGGYTCFVEEVPAAISQGETLAEAKANLLDALKLVLACQRELAEKELSPNAVREPLEFAEA
jgi:predicted RNase H-like HicB family nuclease